ncbi:MAG: hypothetical protein JRJ27_14440 [Deltaproteobacteria bacterium]|nr:hypothetical protein [Deltaproteobacteria bacterium]
MPRKRDFASAQQAASKGEVILNYFHSLKEYDMSPLKNIDWSLNRTLFTIVLKIGTCSIVMIYK